jgi:uncharacterized membrane protein
MRSGSLHRLRLALAAMGLAIAGYLTVLHYDTRVPLVCARGSFVDCESVLGSPSSMVLGLPVAVWGLLWFAAAFVMALLAARAGQRGEVGALGAAGLAWALVGTVAVLWLLYQEIGVVGRICAWCTAVHVLVLTLLVVEVREHDAGRERGDDGRRRASGR